MLADPDTVDEVQEPDEAQEAAPEEQHAEAVPEGQTEGQDAAPAAEPEEVVVTIGEAEPAEAEDEQARAPEWVRDLRKSNREKDRRIRELEQRVQAAQPVHQAPVLGPKPTLAGCDFDEDKFAAEMEAWHGRKTEVESVQRRAQEQQAAQQRQWQEKLDKHNQAKSSIKVKDYEDAEAVVDDLFSVVQQGVMVSGAENSALLKYAIGKNPATAKKLAAITDPIQFAFALAKVEAQLKVQPRKTAPIPERTVRGSAPGSGIDSTLAKLQAEADKTGDRSKVAKYLRDKRAA